MIHLYGVFLREMALFMRSESLFPFHVLTTRLLPQISPFHQLDFHFKALISGLPWQYFGDIDPDGP